MDSANLIQCMIVDDRAVIIGSANINERSQRGNRDSEVAAVVRDTDMMDSTMAGEPFEVGRFAHTLRIRLMREHLGVNVDECEQMEFNMDGLAKACKYDEMVKIWDPEAHDGIGGSGKKHDKSEQGAKLAESASRHKDKNWTLIEANDIIVNEGQKINRNLDEHRSAAGEVPLEWFDKHEAIKIPDNFGRGKVSTTANPIARGIPSTMQRTTNFAEEMEHAKRDPDIGFSLRMHKDTIDADGKPLTTSAQRTRSAKEALDGLFDDLNLEQGPKHTPLIHLGAGNAGPFTSRTHEEETADEKGFEETHEQPFTNPLTGKKIASIDPGGFQDPLSDDFYINTWCHLAISNTDIFREVFRCQPDDQVKTWKDYHKWEKYSEELAKMQGGHRDQQDLSKSAPGGGPAGAPASKLHRGGETSASRARNEANHNNNGPPSDTSSDDATLTEKEAGGMRHHDSTEESSSSASMDHATPLTDGTDAPATHSRNASSGNRKRSGTTGSQTAARNKSSGEIELPTVPMMEKMLCGIRGHLVIWPTEWLIEEDQKNNWLYTLDKVQPIEIYD